MAKKIYIGILIVCCLIDQAAAGFFDVFPNPPAPPPPNPVPEFDGSSSIAVIALLAGVAAIIWSRARNN
jgi:hypothetical protein